MAYFILNNVIRVAIKNLNFMSPSILADILLHPFDFATVLLQIGYDPEGMKYETATLVSVILQYAIFTFYIPYLFTSMQGLQFMGMPHPSIFYYVNYIYSKEGFLGCYRGLMPKICERLIMISVNDRVKRSINRDTATDCDEIQEESSQDYYLRNLINGICSQFFAVIASHPFHVLMVSSFAEFTYNKKSSILELSHSIYKGDGYFGFFTGLTARLLGEILSLTFSVTYTTLINSQMRPQDQDDEINEEASLPRPADIVNYVTDISRFTAFKQTKSVESRGESATVNDDLNSNILVTQRIGQCYKTIHSFLRNLTQNSSPCRPMRENQLRRRSVPILAVTPLTSKLFYYIMLRDYLSKKISNPFFMVCHCAIALGTGWEKFPIVMYLGPLIDFIHVYLVPSKRCRVRKRHNVVYYSKNFNVIIRCLFCKQ